MKLTAKRAELVKAIRTYAESMNGRNGWDVIVECYTDVEIAAVIGRARTVKGAKAKFLPLLRAIEQRRLEAQAEVAAAVGAPSDTSAAHYVVYSKNLEIVWGITDCSCGREFQTEKAAELHAAEANQKLGCYDRMTEGHHLDGSVVRWHHDEHSGDAWAQRTWTGKQGRGSIEIEETETGYVTVERYVPGWRGADIYSAGYCDFDANVPF